MVLSTSYTILEHLLEGCQIIGFDWRYLFINKAAEVHNQRPRLELLEKVYTDMWPGIESTEVYAAIKGCLVERTPSRMENRFVFPDGTVGWFSLSIQPVPQGVFILSIDTTAQRKADEALKSSEQKFSILFEKAAFAATLSKLTDGKLVNVNEAFERSFGYTKREAIGKTTLELGINPDAEAWARFLAAIKETGSVRNQEMSLHTRAGELRFFSVNGELMDIDDEKYILNSSQDITERKRAEEEIVHHLQNVQALQKIDQAIAGSLDLNLTLSVVLEQTAAQLNADAVDVLLLNASSQMFEFAAGVGFRSRSIERSRLHLGEGHAGRAALERGTVAVVDLKENLTQFVRASLLVGEGFSSYFGTPLIAKGQVNGVLEVFMRSPLDPDDNWLGFFKVLAGQAAIAVDSASLFSETKRSNSLLFEAYNTTIEGWSHALDLRDKETEGHTLRVTEMAVRLTRAAKVSEEELVHIRRGALLHDIGKMGVPDHILLKPDKLTDEEWVLMKKHPVFAFDLLTPISYLRPALDIPYCHHEKWDGSGYPRGLKGEQIPLAARLFAVVDVWDALRSDRPYRKGWEMEKILEHIQTLSGTHFDPKAVELFIQVIAEDKDSA